MKKLSFNKIQDYLPRNKKEETLMKAFLLLKSEQDVANFLRDLLTPAEIEEFANRLEIAQLLISDKEYSYQEIAKEVGTSTTTVTRVAQWLFSGSDGYRKVLSKLLKKKL